MFKTTNQHKKYWAERKIDWKQAYCDPDNPGDTIMHPHRQLIIDKLRKMRFGSVLEVGCASGANLYRIQREFRGVQVGGADLSRDAIAEAKRALGPLAILDVASVENMFFGDKSADVVISDMTLIYFGPRMIKKALREIARVARKQIIFCEFHSESFIKSWGLRMATGYNSYNYRKLLENEGFYDIFIDKIPESAWPGGEPQKTFGYIITAKI